ncbi:zinc finger protein swm [Onthophagus taurus]|uniref:zinc finger protein swm n=1 Tax=Onthophagus taurus TaxID=166361 RepID=UPI000C200789|nr:zinc finger protein swm [Onthophagus taurus]XP_022907138.1 zinc finger protein swm [Onthophagus taurus]XP_022907139.1 zinc finger protein swm [Onthophagus taurus]
MFIQDPDAFKTWLTAVLKPMCEADPSALANYVIALVKKDKSLEALRDSMISQLEVFLQGETINFVNLLFKTLDNREYMESVIPNANPPNPNIIAAKPESGNSPLKIQPIKEIKPIIPVSELPNLNETINGSTTNIIEKPPARPSDLKRKSESEKEEKPRRRSRHRSLSRNRSRSRSWDRVRRSRSRDKSRDRDREKRDRARPWRNKSPPRRYDRRRSRSMSLGGRIRSRSRSPRHNYRGRYRNRSPPRSNSRSRSRSKDRKETVLNLKDSHSGAGTPTQDSNHGDMDLRLNSTTQSIQSVVVQQGGVERKRRCRDYDEKGYCMRGEMCPFDHGVDPVVLEDSTLSSVLTTYAPNGAPVPVDVAPGGLLPPVMPPSHPMMHGMPPRGGHLPSEYNPQAPQIFHRGFRGPRPMLGPRIPMNPFPPQPNMQRELIPVPVLDNQQNDHHQFQGNFPGRQQPGFMGGGNVGIPPEHDQDGMFKKRGFDFNRLGPRQKNPANCSLELKKVPPGLNNITHLNNHFSKFGKILNIQVGYENDPEAAIVTFSSHAEANAAYRSTEAVLNNRFIKVFWHSANNEGKQENVPPRSSIKDRLGIPQIVAPNSNKVLNLVQPKAEVKDDHQIEDQSPKKPVDSAALVAAKEERKALVTGAIKKNQELLATKEKLKKNQEEKRKEAMKFSQDLRKRQQELLKKQLEQQKLLISKLEKTPAGPHREQLMETIKKSQEAIEEIRKAILAISNSSTTGGSHKSPAPIKKSKEEAQKEMLDAELDLITKQQEGADTSELQKRIQELKAKTQLMRGPGGVRGRRFAAPIVSRHLLSKNNLVDQQSVTKKVNRFKNMSVDHRPTKILVSRFESDEQKNVLSHFSLAQEMSEEALLQDDEDEDDENEDRPWKR